MADAVVRGARAGDGLGIATVQLEVWRTCFASVLPPALLETPAAELAAAWTSTFQISGSVQVALEGPELVGFVQTDHTDPAVAEIRVLHVRPAWGRRGHGGRLLSAAADALSREPNDGIGVWWIAENDRAAQRFAASVGWQSAGGVRVLDTGRAMLTERRWTGDLQFALTGG